MEDHCDKVRRRLSSAFDEFTKAQKDLSETLDKLIHFDHSKAEHSNYSKKKVQELRLLLEKIDDNCSKFQNAPLGSKVKRAQETIQQIARKKKPTTEKKRNTEQEKKLPTPHDGVKPNNGRDSEKGSDTVALNSVKDEKRKALLMANVYNLKSFEELLSIARSSLDKASDLVHILRAFKQRKVTRELLQSTGAGKLVGKLKKHEDVKVAAMATSVVKLWKDTVLVQQQREERQKSDQASSSSSSKYSSKFSKLTPSEKKNITQHKTTGHHNSSKKRSQGAEGQKKEKKKMKFLDDVAKLTDEEWEKQYLEKCRKGYDRIQDEENFSAYVGKDEDKNAVL